MAVQISHLIISGWSSFVVDRGLVCQQLCAVLAGLFPPFCGGGLWLVKLFTWLFCWGCPSGVSL